MLGVLPGMTGLSCLVRCLIKLPGLSWVASIQPGVLQQLTHDSLQNERKELELGVGRTEYCVYNCGLWWLFLDRLE